jgi:hypothetical protein
VSVVGRDVEQLRDYGAGLADTVRDVGAQTALDFASEWSGAAAKALRTLAAGGSAFSAEDVRDLVGDPPTPNAFGALFLTASRAGLIEPVGIAKSRRIQRHSSWIRMWRGLHR